MSDRVEYLLAELALQVPELAPALARIHIEERSSQAISDMTQGRGSAAVMYKSGRGYIATELMDANLGIAKTVLAHEAMHQVAERAARIKDLAGPSWDGDEFRANKATDRWINQLLVDLQVTTPAELASFGAILPKQGHEEWDLMDIWRAEPRSPGGQGSQGGKAPKPMAGCAPEKGEGDGEGEAEEGEEGGDEGEERHQEAHSILAGMASYCPSLKKMITPPPPTVRWQDVLHEAAAAARGAGISSRPRTTRAKWGRRSTEELPKPGVSSRKPQLVVVVDVSGSMSGLLDAVVAETDLIGKHSEVHLVLHDAAVLFSGKYKRGRDAIRPCGGTDFVPAIVEAERAVAQWPGRSVVVHLTDGFPCGTWPDVPGGFAAGYVGIFGDAGAGIHGPGRWRTRRCGKVGR